MIQFRVRPRAPTTPVYPQCDADFDQENYADHYKIHRSKKVKNKGWDPNRCNREGIYNVGSKCLCTAHAA